MGNDQRAVIKLLDPYKITLLIDTGKLVYTTIGGHMVVASSFVKGKYTPHFEMTQEIQHCQSQKVQG